jgi:aminopeptidase N
VAVAEITRAQTAARARLLRVDSYDVALDLTRGGEVFGSVSAIRFGCTQPGARTYVDLIAEHVREITLNGVSVDPASAYSAGRITLPPLAASNELRVAADCRYSGDGTGLHRSVDRADGTVYTYTKFEPAYARRVFANFEQPDLKAEFRFRITAPAHWEVLSNQPAPEPERDGGTRVWDFPPTPRISTYLTAVAAGDYRVVHASHTTARGQVIPLGLACRASLSGHLDQASILEITRQGLDFYTSLFQGDYPFAKYDQVFVPDYSVGATENVGCVVLTDDLLFRSRVTSALHERRAMVILHEMAHMWFGDLVTMKWWDDLWLNESFAELGGTLASAEATRFTDAWATFSIGRKTWGYRQDQLPSTHPVAADVPTLSQAVAIFDGISYAKGASVLWQLAAVLGRPAFTGGIRSYLNRHAWGNAALADLLAALEASSGQSLAEWSKTWLETAGVSTLRSEFQTDAQGSFSSFSVLQQAPGQQTLRPHRISIGLYSDTGGSLTQTRRVQADIAGARAEVPQLTGVSQPDLVVLNDDDTGYATIRFDPRSLRTLCQSIGRITDPMARTVCWNAAIDMTQQAELPVPAFTRMLAGGMGGEPLVPVLQALHSAARQLMTQIADPAWVPEGMTGLAAAASRLLPDAEPGSDHQLAWAQLLSWTATGPGQLDLLAGLLAGTVAVPGLTADQGLRWAMLRRLTAAGRTGDREIDAELQRDETDSGARHAAACRASVPDATHKAAAWHLLTGATQLSIPAVIETAAGFMLPEHASLIAPYAERYFQVLPEIWSSRGEHYRERLGEALFPYPAASPALLERIDAFLAASQPDAGLARLLTEQRYIVASSLRSRALPDAPAQPGS